MTDTTSPAVARLVCDRADRQRVNRIVVQAYLLAAQKERERKARKLGGQIKAVSRLDRRLITPSTVVSTWLASAQGALYLLISGNATLQIRRRQWFSPIVWKLALLIAAPGIVLDVLMLVVPTMYALANTLLVVYGSAVILGMVAVLACTLARAAWMRSLRPKGVKSSFRDESPTWIATDLASVQQGSPIDLADEVIATINAAVPAGAKVGVKARDKALFRIYARYLTPVGGDNNLALTGTVPLLLSSDEDAVLSDSPVSSTSSELECRK